jgi:hypothetical protein
LKEIFFYIRAWHFVISLVFSEETKEATPMHAEEFLHEMLSPVMHLKRLDTLLLAVNAVLSTKKLSLTNLGRSLSLPIQERSGIRRMDKFLGNEHLHKERKAISKEVCITLIGLRKRPWILVDWSKMPNATFHVLRAALVAEGRALTLYEEVHAESQLGTDEVHRKFLSSLKGLLPVDCCPIVVTDAGFLVPWFSAVKDLGWDFVGRVRGLVQYNSMGGDWRGVRELHQQASAMPTCVGQVLLSKSNPLLCHLSVFLGKKKNRVAKNKQGERRQDSTSLEYEKSAKEPWVLVTSLEGFNVAKRVVKIYRRRMQIEEAFRDLKSSQYGFSFEESYSRGGERLQVLLLIAMLASMIAWLTGVVAERKGWQYQFQANSLKNRRVLSIFF